MTRACGGRFTVEGPVNRGGESAVFRGYDNEKNEKVAIRVINMAKVPKEVLALIEREVRILAEVKHENVICLRIVVPDTMVGDVNATLLVYELAEGGELFEYLYYTEYFEEDLARYVFYQLINALQKCHEMKVCHRNIKPENILFDKNYKLKLSDFSLGVIVEDANELLQVRCGCGAYMAPEVINGSGYCGATADIWSAAVVLFVMLTGSMPFQVASERDWWYNECKSGRYDRFWESHLQSASHLKHSHQAQDLLNRIFVANPQDRLTLEGILEHDWMKGAVLNDDDAKHELHRRRIRIQEIKSRELATSQQLLQLNDKYPSK